MARAVRESMARLPSPVENGIFTGSGLHALVVRVDAIPATAFRW